MRAARSPLLMPGAELTNVPVNALATDAAHYWEAGVNGRLALAAGHAVCAREWTCHLHGLSLAGHDRIRGLAAIRADQFEAALNRHFALRLA